MSQVTQFGQSCERRGVEHHLIELDPLKNRLQLRRPPLRTPLTSELWQVLLNLRKGYPIAAIVRTARTIRNRAARKCLANDFRNLAHGVVLRFGADVECFATYGLSRSFERSENRLADILDVNQRA